MPVFSRLEAGACALAVTLIGASAGALTLERAMELALAQNPELLAEAAALGVYEARFRSLSPPTGFNPELSVVLGPRFQTDGVVAEFGVGLSQTFEVFGERAMRRDVARADDEWAKATHRANRAAVAAKTRHAFIALLAAQKSQLLAEEALELAGDALRAAQARQEAGAATRLEVNTSRAEEARARRDVMTAKTQATKTRAELRELMGVPATYTFEAQGTLPIRAPDILPDGELQARALEHRAEITAANERVRLARQQFRLAERQALSNPTFGVEYAREDGTDHLMMGSVSLPLPFFDRNASERGEARATLTEVELRLEAVRVRVVQEVRLAAAQARGAAAVLALYEDGLKGALEENLAMGQEAYRAGKLDFFGLLLVRRQVLEGRSDFIKAQQELADALTELDRALGVMP